MQFTIIEFPLPWIMSEDLTTYHHEKDGHGVDDDDDDYNNEDKIKIIQHLNYMYVMWDLILK